MLRVSNRYSSLQVERLKVRWLLLEREVVCCLVSLSSVFVKHRPRNSGDELAHRVTMRALRTVPGIFDLCALVLM